MRGRPPIDNSLLHLLPTPIEMSFKRGCSGEESIQEEEYTDGKVSKRWIQSTHSDVDLAETRHMNSDFRLEIIVNNDPTGGCLHSLPKLSRQRGGLYKGGYLDILFSSTSVLICYCSQGVGYGIGLARSPPPASAKLP